jgi:hypothetical protein
MIPSYKCFCKIPRAGVVASLHKSMNNFEILILKYCMIATTSSNFTSFKRNNNCLICKHEIQIIAIMKLITNLVL